MALMECEPIFPIAWVEVEPKRLSKDPDLFTVPLILPVTAKGNLGARVIYPTSRKEEWLDQKKQGKEWHYLEPQKKSST